MRLRKPKKLMNPAVVNDADLFPNGMPTAEADVSRMFELYKLMVASSGLRLWSVGGRASTPSS